MEISVDQLISLLEQQKRIVINQLAGASHYYNQESTDSHSIPLKIDKEKFTELGIRSRYPRYIEVLKSYNIK